MATSDGRYPLKVVGILAVESVLAVGFRLEQALLEHQGECGLVLNHVLEEDVHSLRSQPPARIYGRNRGR